MQTYQLGWNEKMKDAKALKKSKRQHFNIKYEDFYSTALYVNQWFNWNGNLEYTGGLV